MIKLVVFDLDGTLAPAYGSTPKKDLETLKLIEKSGVKIGICSGKPNYYISGYLRQADWGTPILMGENGSTIQFGTFTPPEFCCVLPHAEEAEQSITLLKKLIDEKIPDMWYQPNSVALTPFPRKQEEFDIIDNIIEENRDKLKGITVYKHCDSFDIVLAGINKGAAVKFLCQKFGIEKHEVVTVGDGINDYSMFAESDNSIGINVPDKTKARYNVATLREALNLIIGMNK